MRVVYYEGSFKILVYDSEEHQKTLKGKIFDSIFDDKIFFISFDDDKKNLLIINPALFQSWEFIQSFHLTLSHEEHGEIFSRGGYKTIVENYLFNFILQH